MNRLAVILLCVLPGMASSASLYRCIDPSGHVSYQSASCAVGQRTDRTIEFTPQPAARPAVHASTVKPVVQRLHRGSAARHGSNGIRNQQPSPCARAKAKRERQLQRLGLKRSFEDLSRADAAVRPVCNGY